MSQLEIDETTVTYKATSAREASEVAADLRHKRNRNRGLAGMMDNAFRTIGDIANVAGPRVLWAIALSLSFVASMYAYKSFSRIMPEDTLLSPGLGVGGVGVVIAAKFFASRWATENFEEDKAEASNYRTATVGLCFLLIIVGAAFRASVEEDQQSGVTTAHQIIDNNETRIRNLGYELEDLRRAPEYTARSVDDLSMDLRRALSRTAFNRNGDDTGQPIAEFVNAGTEDFCVGSSYYVERYCPDILDIEEQLQYRVEYEEKEAELSELRAATDELMGVSPERSSVMSFVDGAEFVTGSLGRYILAAAIIGFLDIIMLWLTYRARWAWLVAEKKGTL